MSEQPKTIGQHNSGLTGEVTLNISKENNEWNKSVLAAKGQQVYTQKQLEAAVNERVAIVVAEIHRMERLRNGDFRCAGCHAYVTKADGWESHILAVTPKDAIDAQKKRDARMKLEELNLAMASICHLCAAVLCAGSRWARANSNGKHFVKTEIENTVEERMCEGAPLAVRRKKLEAAAR